MHDHRHQPHSVHVVCNAFRAVDAHSQPSCTLGDLQERGGEAFEMNPLSGMMLATRCAPILSLTSQMQTQLTFRL